MISLQNPQFFFNASVERFELNVQTGVDKMRNEQQHCEGLHPEGLQLVIVLDAPVPRRPPVSYRPVIGHQDVVKEDLIRE